MPPGLVAKDVVQDTNEDDTDFTNDPSLPVTFNLKWEEAQPYTNYDLEYGTNHNVYPFQVALVSTNIIQRTNGVARTFQTLQFTLPNTYTYWYMRMRADIAGVGTSRWSNEARYPDWTPNAIALRWSPRTNADIMGSPDLEHWTTITNSNPPFIELMSNVRFFRTAADVSVTNRIKTFYLAPPDDLVQP